MSVKRIKNHGKWVYQARVAYRGLRKAALRATKEAARDAEADLLRELKRQAGEAEQAGARPATMKALLESRPPSGPVRSRARSTGTSAPSGRP